MLSPLMQACVTMRSSPAHCIAAVAGIRPYHMVHVREVAARGSSSDYSAACRCSRCFQQAARLECQECVLHPQVWAAPSCTKWLHCADASRRPAHRSLSNLKRQGVDEACSAPRTKLINKRGHGVGAARGGEGRIICCQWRVKGSSSGSVRSS